MIERPIITLLTDFGLFDYYVGAVKGVLLSLAPKATLVDVSHDVPPGDVEHAAFLLAATVGEFPPSTVHLAVVDPGVGGSRRLLAARLDEAFVVAPDNGLVSYALASANSAEVRSIERSDLFLERPGTTFDGRSRFAPAAAFLARGEQLGDLGPSVERPKRISLGAPTRTAGSLTGRVLHIDRFGNLITDLPTSWLAGRRFRVRIGSHVCSRLASHYAELEPDEPAVLPGSLGTLELSLNGGNLATEWDAHRGQDVEIKFR